MTRRLTLGLALAASVAAAPAAAQTLRLATVVNAPHAWIDAAEVFKEHV